MFLFPPHTHMDNDVFLLHHLHQQLKEMEDDVMDGQQRLAGIATAIIVLGAIEAQRLCVCRAT
jgi:hypothetical protein